ncbi:MAG: aminoacyl-tRNA hydrolase [Phycisphaerae bacterium]
MKLIVGLGNPGPQYANTRHNVGFRVAEALERRWTLGGWKEKFSACVADGRIHDQRVVLLRPQTFMNRSGQAVMSAGRFYKCDVADLLLISDDLDLEPGRLRLRANGSSGGQRGLEDVIARLGTDEFARLRIGIGRPARGDPIDYILGPFNAADEEWLTATLQRACDAVECWVQQGIETAMNTFNRSTQV